MKKCKKLQLSDLEILTPGAQIFRKINEEFGSLEAFGEKIHLYPDSIKQYLYSKALGSGSFKIKLTMAFDLDFHALYITEEEQIKQHVKSLLNHQNAYNKKEDICVLERLKKICFEREMLKEYIDVCRVYANYYYNKNDHDRSIAYFDLVIDYLKKRDGQPRLILTMSELGLALLSKCDKERLQDLKSYIIRRLERSEDDYIYDMDQIYFNLGLIYIHLKKREDALRMFCKAEMTTDKITMKVKCLIARGDESLHKEEYANAEALYLQAREILLLKGEDELIEENLVSHSLARLYYRMNQIKKAEVLMDQVMNSIEHRVTSTRNDYIKIFTQIKLRLRKKEEVIRCIEGIVNEEKEGYIHFLHHLNVINQIVTEMEAGNSLLKDLQLLLVRKAREERGWDSDCMDRIKMIIGTIMIKG